VPLTAGADDFIRTTLAVLKSEHFANSASSAKPISWRPWIYMKVILEMKKKGIKNFPFYSKSMGSMINNVNIK
jgi:hypothetical protein